MPAVLADLQNSTGLDFNVELPDIKVDDVTLDVTMGQDGTSVELRDTERHLLLRLDGNELDKLYREDRINVARPDVLKRSVFEYWKSKRTDPEAPTSFRLDIAGAVDAEQLIGKVKLLLDFLMERRHLAVRITSAPPLQAPSAPPPGHSPEPAAPATEIPTGPTVMPDASKPAPSKPEVPNEGRPQQAR